MSIASLVFIVGFMAAALLVSHFTPPEDPNQ